MEGSHLHTSAPWTRPWLWPSAPREGGAAAPKEMRQPDSHTYCWRGSEHGLPLPLLLLLLRLLPATAAVAVTVAATANTTSTSLPVCVSVCLGICLSVCLSAYLSVCLPYPDREIEFHVQ